ncbi:hypothetical protein [Pseudobacteroides cellulosolvens]|uniref:Uncharacterized protein n=1 Tax=Pseudobacteroides cellulosolvens ATCC 35603 = DSM 2933 TaxID=398512 RepID=A0A0L6JRP0_9FIRM|nr:hypothetical protein [Pseudobacteroides cellulosolvens]KNY28355.1 hypothetical protein Bccel_3629 [Pseudobacteroides cellulosolvens ATCC 35603 = DSM 2933]
MDYVQRFPFIISAVMAIVIGTISYTGKDDLKQTCIKMTIALVIFYIIGASARSVLYSIHEELEKRKEEMEKANNEEVNNEEVESDDNEEQEASD